MANEAEAFLAADALPPGSAAKFAGRLAFATSWAAGRLGRPVLRPIFDQALKKLLCGFRTRCAPVERRKETHLNLSVGESENPCTD
eukprot:scaffold10462_cov119-Isochrysis_galbana.AAC.13